MIDRIEYDVEQAKDYIEPAKKNIKKARKYKEKFQWVSIDVIHFINNYHFDCLLIFFS